MPGAPTNVHDVHIRRNRCRGGEERENGCKRRVSRVSCRCACSGPDPIRGRPILHRGARLARCRGRQGGKPAGRRSGPLLVRPAVRPEREPEPGLLVFPVVQRQQEIHHRQPQIRAWARSRQEHGATLGDTGTGMLLAISILAALYRRRDTRQGERIEIAMQDAMLQYIRVALSTQATYGVAAKRNGSKVVSGFAAPSGIYPCKPGGPNDYLYVYTSRTNPAHWSRLLEVIGRKDLIGDPRFDTAAARLEHEPEVDAIIAGWTRQHDKREAMRVLGEAGVPVGAIFDTME